MAGNLTAMMASIFSGGATPDPYFEYTTLLLPGNGTNGAQNNTFLDGSTNNFTITRNGNTTQGTFSPFSQTGWGNYFDGSGDFLTVGSSSNFDFGSGDFCLETWFYSGNTGDNCVLAKRQTAAASGWALSIQYFSAVIGGTWRANFIGEGTTNLSVNTWYHLVVTRSGNTFRYFKNGRLVNSNSSYSGAVQNHASALAVGCGGAAGNEGLFTGYISNARITIGSIPADYQTSSTTPNAQIFTPPTAPLTAISGTSLLTCQSNRFIDNSTNNFTITRNGDTSVVAFSPFNPTASWSAATYGGSGYFDGSGDYLSVASNTALTFGTGDFTVEGWFYASSFPTQPALLNIGSDAGGLVLTIAGAKIYAYFVGVGNVFGSGGSTLVTNNWYHFAWVRSGSTNTFYINGSVYGATYNSSANHSSTGGAGIGYSVAGSVFNAFAGYISNVRIVKGTAVYTSAFTPPTAPLTAITNTSLLLNFTNAGIYDATSKNDLETVGNAQVSTAQYKFPPSSMYFDGAADYLLPNGSATNMFTFGTGDFTVEFWMNAISFTTPTIIIFDCRPLSTDGVYPTIYFSSGQIRYFVNNLDRITGSTLSTSQWYHIALSRSGTNTKLFVDGAQVGSTYTDSNNYLCGANRPSIGCRGFTLGDNNYYGYMQDLRVTKGYARYTSNFTPPTAAFPTL